MTELLENPNFYSFAAGAAFLVLALIVVWISARSRAQKRNQTLEQKSDQAKLSAPEPDILTQRQSPPEPAASTPAPPMPAFTSPTHPAVKPVTAPLPTTPVREKDLSSALANTKGSFLGRIKEMFSAKPKLSAYELDELEEILYTSDLGPQTVQRLMGAVEAKLKTEGGSGFEAVVAALKKEMQAIFDSLESSKPIPQETAVQGLEELMIWKSKPAILMVVGVNGAGKTTTIGKLASRIAQANKKVLVAAGDTFRAAAGDQLKVWTERAQVEIFSPENVGDPSAVAFQAIERGQKEGFDVIIIDTAGRLHTQKNLMEELKKMKRVMSKLSADAPHETLLVLDANSGQNALIQAKEFHQALGVTGVVLTKLDGTAKGGVAVGLAHELQLPIKLIGVGEGITDLRKFSSREFVDSII